MYAVRVALILFQQTVRKRLNTAKFIPHLRIVETLVRLQLVAAKYLGAVVCRYKYGKNAVTLVDVLYVY